MDKKVFNNDDYCDVYNGKICDNCGDCLEMQGIDTKAIRIADIAKEVEENKKIEETLKKLDEEDEEVIKALSASSENFGNFFGQNLFAGSSGVLLITSTLNEQGFEVLGIDIAKASFIMALVALLVVFLQNKAFDAKIARKYKLNEDKEGK